MHILRPTARDRPTRHVILRHSFEPQDNLRLAHLCGALDEHLRSIEAALVWREGVVLRWSADTLAQVSKIKSRIKTATSIFGLLSITTAFPTL